MNPALTAPQREQIEQALLARKAELTEAMEGASPGVSRVERAGDELAQGSDDAAKHSVDREVDYVLNAMEVDERAAIDAALLRLRSDSAGHCVGCNEAIGFERLRAKPWALTCIACATAREVAPGGATHRNPL